MSPGRASSGLTILRPLLPAWALCTQVDTAAQPPPGILWPACCSDQVTNDAHHGLPGDTPAAARYLSTCGPVFELPISWTPFWLCATRSAAAPSGLVPAPLGAAAPASTTPPGAGCAGACAGAGAGWGWDFKSVSALSSWSW